MIRLALRAPLDLVVIGFSAMLCALRAVLSVLRPRPDPHASRETLPCLRPRCIQNDRF